MEELEKIDILSLTKEELTSQITAMGEKAFRAKQIYDWLHVKKVSDFSQMSNISAQFREELSRKFCLKHLIIKKKLVSALDNTVKYLYGLPDGEAVETVLMEYKHGNSLCISTQVGCLMGIGEPLDNYDNVMRFLTLMNSEGDGMSLRHISLSTCGVVPRIYDLAELKTGLTLSISLHAATDERRSEIMPINRKYHLDELMKACRHYFAATGRRISFEYSLIEGVNDTEQAAQELINLLGGMTCHVNLIPINEIRERDFRKSRSVERFQKRLCDAGINATVRRTLGADISAACGQLRRDGGMNGQPGVSQQKTGGET